MTTHTVLTFISKNLNIFLTKKFDIDENKVVVNRIIDAEGSIPRENNNKIVISLINIVMESNIAGSFQKMDSKNEKIERHYYSFYIMVNSNFNDYSESLLMLDATIEFFNEHYNFRATSYPDFPKELSQITMELFRSDFLDICNVWTSIGTKYQPSVIYKVRQV